MALLLSITKNPLEHNNQHFIYTTRRIAGLLIFILQFFLIGK